MATIAEARKAATEKRERRERRERRQAAEAKRKAAKKPEKKEESGFFASIRKAFSSDDDIDRIDAAVDALQSGVDEADKRKK